MNSTFKQALKAKAHHLKPIVLLGTKGLTIPVIEEIDRTLNAHELIKVKINGPNKEERQKIAALLCQQLRAELIQVIGNTVIIYRKKT